MYEAADLLTNDLKSGQAEGLELKTKHILEQLHAHSLKFKCSVDDTYII